jgi:hypothetical protein
MLTTVLRSDHANHTNHANHAKIYSSLVFETFLINQRVWNLPIGTSTEVWPSASCTGLKDLLNAKYEKTHKLVWPGYCQHQPKPDDHPLSYLHFSRLPSSTHLTPSLRLLLRPLEFYADPQ